MMGDHQNINSGSRKEDVSTKRRNYLLTKPEERELQQKLQREYLSGAWSTYHEAALRHGVPDSVVGRLMRRIKVGIAETVKEQREEEVDRTLLQIEGTIGKALEAFEISRRARLRCKLCKGLGEQKDGTVCDQCDGEGYTMDARSGDSKHLLVVLKALEQKAKIYAMHPERRTTRIGQQYNLIQGGEADGMQNPLMGASTELLIRARRLLLELKEGGNGEILDAEIVERDDNRDREGSDIVQKPGE